MHVQTLPLVDRAIKYGQASTWRVRANENPIFWKIQNKYFYSVPYSNETLYMKVLEYQTYFIHIDSEHIVMSLEDIQIFFSIWNTECLAKRWVNI
jgi:hypothetical protein